MKIYQLSKFETKTVFENFHVQLEIQGYTVDLKILNLDIQGKPKLIEFKAYFVLGKPVNPKLCFCHQPPKLL